MTIDDARRRLAMMVAADSEPTLAADEVADLLQLVKRADVYGLLPADTGWIPTYDLNAAAAEGWRRKAGKVSGSNDFSVDGDSYSDSQQHAMCLEMARSYAAKSSGTISLAPTFDDEYVVANRHAY